MTPEGMPTDNFETDIFNAIITAEMNLPEADRFQGALKLDRAKKDYDQTAEYFQDILKLYIDCSSQETDTQIQLASQEIINSANELLSCLLPVDNTSLQQQTEIAAQILAILDHPRQRMLNQNLDTQTIPSEIIDYKDRLQFDYPSGPDDVNSTELLERAMDTFRSDILSDIALVKDERDNS